MTRKTLAPLDAADRVADQRPGGRPGRPSGWSSGGRRRSWICGWSSSVRGTLSAGFERSSNTGTPTRPAPWGLTPIRTMGSFPRLGATPPAEACASAKSSAAGLRYPALRPSILTGVDAPQEPPHPGAGREPAADGRRGGRGERSRATPVSTSAQRPELALVLGLAVALTILVNVFMLQRRFRPLERLVDEMERADLSRPGANLRRAVDGRADPEEVARLQLAFRRMLERLEAERRRTSSAALAAQEEERARVARDLHDEVNQSLTALLLRLEAARVKAPVELAARARRDEGARQPGDGGAADAGAPAPPHRARRPRPQGGPGRPRRRARASGRDQRRASRPQGDFSALPSDVQLVVYRVAQEALSNAARHSGAETRQGPPLRGSRSATGIGSS